MVLTDPFEAARHDWMRVRMSFLNHGGWKENGHSSY